MPYVHLRHPGTREPLQPPGSRRWRLLAAQPRPGAPQRDVASAVSERVVQLHALCPCRAIGAAHLHPWRQLRPDEVGLLLLRRRRCAAAGLRILPLRLHVSAAVLSQPLHLCVPIPRQVCLQVRQAAAHD